MNKILMFILCAYYSSGLMAETFEVEQSNKQFSENKLTIQVGDRIEFPNKDPFFHNVYSLSAINSFELGSYPPGESRGIVFDKSGVAQVSCAIHPDMKLIVTVKP